MTTALGIDPSVSATGIVHLRGGLSVELLLEKDIKPPTKLKGISRQLYIVTEIMTLIHMHLPDVIVVEGYSLNMRNASSVVPLVELGGLLRAMMYLDGLKWNDPRAPELKKFVTGKGNSPKSEMMMHVLKRWGHTSKSDNTADAYGLACMGLCTLGQLPNPTKPMLEIAGALPLRAA